MHGNERLRNVPPHPVSIEFFWKYFKFPKFPISGVNDRNKPYSLDPINMCSGECCNTGIVEDQSNQ